MAKRPAGDPVVPSCLPGDEIVLDRRGAPPAGWAEVDDRADL